MRKPYFKILSLILSSAIIATSVDISTLSVYARTSSTDASIVESTELREDAIADNQVEKKGVANGKYGDEIVAHDVEVTDGLVAETAEEFDEVATYEQEESSDEWEEPVNPDGMYVEFEDGTRADVTYGYKDTGITSAANIFTANRDEDLKAVSIMLGNTDIDYTIQIYLNPDDNNPESGVPMLSSPQTGHTDYAGYYTIPLDETVALDEGDRFAVVFKSTKSLGLFIDQYADWRHRYEDDDGHIRSCREVHDSYAKEEQSYYIIDRKWVDFNEGYGTVEEQRGKVACIHVFTDDAAEGKEAPSSIDCINLRDDALSLEVGEYYDVETKLTYANEAADKYKRLIYTADDPTIAYVDNKGHVVAKKTGRTKITVASKIQPEVKKEFTLDVLGGAYVTLGGVTDGVLEYDFATKEKLYGTISCEPEEYTPNTIEWISSNEKVIAFEEGTSADEMKKELLVKNPGKTDITVMMNGKCIDRYSVTVQPKSDSFGLTMNAYLKFSGEVELKWSGNDIIKGYKVVDAANKVRYSCNKNEENNYTYKERTFVGKTLGDNNISLRVIALYDYYETATKVVTKAYEPESEGKVEITGHDFDERVVSIKCIMNYPHSSADLSEERHYSIKYKDNEVVFGIDDDVPTEWYEKYEVNSWLIYGVGEAHIGDYVNEVFADSVIWSLDKGDNYECDVTLVWSQNEVKAVQFSIPDSEKLILDSGTKLRLSTSTPGARIRYRILSDVDNNGSITVYDTHVIEYNANGYIELNYSKKNEDDPDIALINIVAWAEKDNYYNSVFKEISYNVRAKNWGTIPAEVYNADDCEYKGDSDSVPKKLWAYGYGDRTYTGSAITFPDMKVFYYKTLLVEGKDYTVKYSNNTDANTEYKNIDELSPAQIKKLPCITITGKGDYSGSSVIYFGIEQKDIGDSDVEISNAIVEGGKEIIPSSYSDKEQKVLPIIKKPVGNKLVTLKNKTDYDVEFADGDYTSEGQYSVKISGKGNYCGDRDYYIDIAKAVMFDSASVSKIDNQNYTGENIDVNKLNITVKSGGKVLTRTTSDSPENGHYYATIASSEDSKNTGVVKVTLVGTNTSYEGVRVKGQKIVTFNIVGTSIKKVTIDMPKSVVYKGTAWKINDDGFPVSLYDAAQNKTLVENKDFTVKYDKNIDTGTATVEFTGINAYEGTVKKTVKITPYNLNDDKIEAKLVGAPVNGLLRAKYTKKGSKPNVEITFKTSEGTKHLEENKDYKLTYVNNGAVFDENGNSKKMPTVKIVGKGNYTGTNTELVFLIGPQSIGNTDDIRIAATDTFAGKYNSTITLYDVNSDNAKLKAGTDYDKNIDYRYENETIVQVKSGNKYTTVRRGRGSSVRNTDIIPAGTQICAIVDGINNYAGRRTVSFRVAECDIAKANVDFDVVYNVNGGAIEPDYDDFIVTYKNVENPLIALEDYEIVEFTNNTKAGTATMTIRGLGTYGGIKTVKFKINATKLQ